MKACTALARTFTEVTAAASGGSAAIKAALAARVAKLDLVECCCLGSTGLPSSGGGDI